VVSLSSARNHSTKTCTNPKNTHSPFYVAPKKSSQIIVVAPKKTIILASSPFVRSVSHTVNPIERYDTGSYFEEPEVRSDTQMKYCYTCKQRKVFVKRGGIMGCNTCT